MTKEIKKHQQHVPNVTNEAKVNVVIEQTTTTTTTTVEEIITTKEDNNTNNSRELEIKCK